MVYYSIEAVVVNYEKLVDEKSIPANVFQPKTEQAFLKTGRRSFIFIVRCRHQKVTCGAVVKDTVRIERDLAAFWRMTGPFGTNFFSCSSRPYIRTEG